MKDEPKKGESFLPDDLLWAAGGHASDVVLTAMADGQVELVPPAVLAHVHRCTPCTTHLGNAALLSLHTGRELLMVAREASKPVRAPLPRLFIAMGLVFAFLGLVPTLLDAPAQIGGAKAFAMHDAPMFARGLQTLGRRLLEPGSSLGLALTYGAAAFFLLMAFFLVRWLPKKEVSR